MILSIISDTTAAFLAGKKYDTLLVEAGEPSLSIIINNADIDEGPRSWLPRLDVVRSSKPKEYVRARKWQYIVVDLGARKADEVTDEEYDLILAVLPQMHRIFRLDNSWDDVKEEHLTFIAADKDTVRYWQGKNIEKGFRARVFSLPEEFFAGGWSDGGEKVNRSCTRLLEELLPEESGRDKKNAVRVAAILVLLSLPIIFVFAAGFILPDSTVGQFARQILYFLP